MAKLTRKELKSDKFAQEVQHSVEFVSGHREQMIRWGAAALALVLIVAGFFYYRNYQHAARQEALHAAMLVQNAEVGPQAANVIKFGTAEARKTAVLKSWRELAAKYPGSEEGRIAEYFLGTNAADDGNLADAEKHFKAYIGSGNGPYAPLGKLALAQIYAGEGKVKEGADLLQSLIDHPTVLVSKETATLALADLLKTSDRQRARKLVEPLRTSTRSAVSRAAINLDGELNQQ